MLAQEIFNNTITNKLTREIHVIYNFILLYHFTFVKLFSLTLIIYFLL